MYAVIQTGGKQYRVQEGDIIYVEKLKAEENSEVTFEDVLMYEKDGKVKIGTPLLKNVKVTGKLLAHCKGEKILVYKFKAKKNYRKLQGHRQPYSRVEITKIDA